MRGVGEDIMEGDFVKHWRTGRLGKVLWIGRRGRMVVEFHGRDYGFVEEWRWVGAFVKAQNAPRMRGDIANYVPPERRMASSAWRWLSWPY